MRYPTLPSGELLAAWETMPRTTEGSVVDLHYVPKQKLTAYEAQWREWGACHSRAVWPDWLIAWADGR